MKGDTKILVHLYAAKILDQGGNTGNDDMFKVSEIPLTLENAIKLVRDDFRCVMEISTNEFNRETLKARLRSEKFVEIGRNSIDSFHISLNRI